MADDKRIREPEVKAAQAKLMLAKRITGASLDDIAQQFNLSKDTVNRRIKLAMRAGLLDEATDSVLGQLVPHALKVYADALLGGDIDVARDILFGTGILKKNHAPDSVSVQMTAEMTLDQFRDQLEAARKLDDPTDETTDLFPDAIPAHRTVSTLPANTRTEVCAGDEQDGVSADEQLADADETPD